MLPRQIPIEGNPAFEALLIMNSFSGQTMASLFSTHPPTEARIQALLKLDQSIGNR